MVLEQCATVKMKFNATQKGRNLFNGVLGNHYLFTMIKFPS